MLETVEGIKTLVEAAFRPFLFPLLGGERIFWLYLGSALVIALVAYLRMPRAKPLSLGGFFSYAFPGSVYGHPSAWVDYQYFILNSLVLFLVIFPLTAAISPVISSAVQDLCLLWKVPEVFAPSPIAVSLLYTVCLALVGDFAVFYAHYLQHRIPWMWEFHKAHHSAEVLTPITVYRMHPFDDLLALAFSMTVTGLVDGIFQSLVAGPFGMISVFNLNLLLFAFYFVGYNLRHSHIWVDYGPVADQVFISPAQHQIHHSTDPRHFDKNMGFIFAFWDRMFGTLYVPQGREHLEFGLNREGEHKAYHSVATLYLRPFARIWAQLKTIDPVPVAILLMFTAGLAWMCTGPVVKYDPRSVMMEELTSPEVKGRIAQGDTTVIVPTGGLEQNGPHMVLGKHNYVVRYTARRIAELNGHTLVAPVIPYSPAGEIEPPSSHMRFSGSISLPEPAFEAILEAAARSLKQHGFKKICFVGDHGWSQAAQAKVAEKLSREWRQDGVLVMQVGDYYYKNGQNARLLLSGKSPADIGEHAGMRDTSELWRVYPEGIRKALRQKGDSKTFATLGVSGNPGLASAELGETLLEMKIRAAVRQIQAAGAAGAG